MVQRDRSLFRGMNATDRIGRPWSLQNYLDMHTQLIEALKISEEELKDCDEICGKNRREIPQDIFILCIVVRACCLLTGQYSLDPDQLSDLLALVIADNSYLPFGYSIIQKECLFKLAELEHDIPMGTDPLDAVSSILNL
ncbi:MAG: hypothetical protein JOZ18_03835 [Chloroflexi bacterium]|nr:hypothetical protein [Chloroflexota bacterium]